MYINGQRETVCNYVAVITNERFYFAGTEGSAVLFHLKTGSVELKDVHAITVGANSALAAKYVQFEVKNDNYRATTFTDVNVIKDVLDKVVKECASKNNTANVVQAAFSSADELKKFKELLDLGIITQEEFDAKKKQLLGL
nr:SHOCT domain-containing protein [Lachnospiraceae bacterium]